MALFNNPITPLPEAVAQATQQLADLKERKANEANTELPWNERIRHSILLYGQPKIGKTWAYCSIIDEAVSKGKRIFLINTDAGLVDTARAYFGDRFSEVAKQLMYYSCFNTADGAKATKEIIAQAKIGDWVIVDLVSDFWTMAQDEFLASTKMSPDEYIQLASKDPAKFGLFDSNKWNYIKKLDNLITLMLPKRGNYNILCVAGAKDIKAEKAISKKAEHEYDVVGFKPEGQKTLGYNFSTILYLFGDKNRYFKFVGHRGKNLTGQTVEYKNNFWKTYIEKIAEEQKQ